MAKSTKQVIVLLQPAFSDKPKIVERGSYTKAAPVKEKKNFLKVSDSIGNNYSPGARNFTTSYLYNTTKLGELSLDEVSSYSLHSSISKSFFCEKLCHLLTICWVCGHCEVFSDVEVMFMCLHPLL